MFRHLYQGAPLRVGLPTCISIKDRWTIDHCLRLVHETMVCTVCLSIFLCTPFCIQPVCVLFYFVLPTSICTNHALCSTVIITHYSLLLLFGLLSWVYCVNLYICGGRRAKGDVKIKRVTLYNACGYFGENYLWHAASSMVPTVWCWIDRHIYKYKMRPFWERLISHTYDITQGYG